MSEPTAWPSATRCKHVRRIAACPDCGARWDLNELDRLQAENARLREVLEDLLPYARATVGLPVALYPRDSAIVKAEAILTSTAQEDPCQPQD